MVVGNPVKELTVLSEMNSCVGPALRPLKLPIPHRVRSIRLVTIVSSVSHESKSMFLTISL